MPTFYARRQGSMIVPNSRAAAVEMERLPERVVFRVDAKVPRKGKHHRLVWALFSLTAAALNDGPAPSAKTWGAEDVAEFVKLATGHVDTFRLRPADAKRYGTSVGIRPASISYDKMDEAEFGRFSDAAMGCIRTELCPYIEDSPQWAEIAQIIDASRPSEAAA
jgi:hypothetical protein